MVPKEPLKIKANEFEFFIDEEHALNSDIVQVDEDTFNVLINGRSVNVKITPQDMGNKKIRTEVNGNFYDVVIEDQLDQMLQRMGFNSNSGKQISEIKAPMPGLVKEISVSGGQEVKEGDRILILEAMKMENSILIHGNGKIKKVLVKPGQAVEKLQKLVELE